MGQSIVPRSSCVGIVMLIIAASAVSCSGRGERSAISLCDLRDHPQRFVGRTVRASGWIYTNIESFTLLDNSCGISLGDKIEGLGNDTDDPELNHFLELVRIARKGTYNINGDIFIVAEGNVKSATGPVGVRNPNELLISKMICSIPARVGATDKADAISLCLKERRSPPANAPR